MSYTLGGGRIENTRSAENERCQLCTANLTHLTLFQREQHYDKHFSDEPKASSSTKPKPLRVDPPSESPSKCIWKDWRNHKGQDQFWHPAQSAKPPSNFTPGLIPLLKTHLKKSHAAGNTRRATLCYDRAVLVNRETWDAGWGCGYRNFMMACSSLMDQPFQPLYFPLLDDPIPPSVRNLQQWIEDAWKAGFDPEGKRELKKLVDTKKWIGTSDVQVAFTSRGIPSKLVDFDLKSSEKGAAILTDWVVEYFSHPSGAVDANKVVNDRRPKTINDALLGASAVTVTSRMPLILQHDGHSRTIVGYEVSKTGYVNLLMFDPSKLPSKRLRQTALELFASAPARHNAAPNTTNAVASSSSVKRPATALSLNNPTPLKRSRVDNQEGGSSRVEHADDDDEDDEVEIIHDSRDQNVPGRGKLFLGRDKKKAGAADTISTPDTLKFFRVDPKKLVRKKAYQILYFPMYDPLSDAEKHAARGMNVYGEKIS
ncbi:peptidase family C78-domain-containing protein [Mycena rosella]|uniref:Peptidase family C78-domain-containing protein n=1 Tax=Mycena rosella TaxID=1033263 RepID=A0AAD7GQV0_MYCRO|nr:peptidase family C78-domain-containing protein [Mycena rosella]